MPITQICIQFLCLDMLLSIVNFESNIYTLDIYKYVNLLGVTYSLCVLLPFINAGLSEYKFKSPQDVKYNLSEHITKELFFTKLLKTLQLPKIIATVEDVISYFASHDEVS